MRQRARRPRADRHSPLPGGFGHQLAATTSGLWGATTGLGQAGAGKPTLREGLARICAARTRARIVKLPNATRQTIEGMPAQRYQERFKAERAKLRRHYCTVFKFWRTCRYKPCQRARACLGDADVCLKRGAPAVPRPTQWQARQELLKAMPAGAGAPERAARERMPSELYRQE